MRVGPDKYRRCSSTSPDPQQSVQFHNNRRLYGVSIAFSTWHRIERQKTDQSAGTTNGTEQKLSYSRATNNRPTVWRHDASIPRHSPSSIPCIKRGLISQHDEIMQLPCMPPPSCLGTGQPRPAWPPPISPSLPRSPRLSARRTTRLAYFARLPEAICIVRGRKGGRFSGRMPMPSMSTKKKAESYCSKIM